MRKTVTGGGRALLLFYTMWSGMDRNGGILCSGMVVYYGAEYPLIQSLKKHDMTDQQYNVLHVLRGYRDKGLQNIGFIKEHMLDKQSEMSRIIDRLYEKELVSRKENLEDHSQKSVEITEKEMKLLDEMYDCEKASDNFLSKLSPEDVDELKRLLDKIRN